MWVVISISVIAVLLTYINSKNKYRLLPLYQLSFIIVTFLQVIHYDYGNDYMNYYYMHMMYEGLSIEDFIYLRDIGDGSFKDLGWAVSYFLLPGRAGFFILVGIISIIQNYIYYKLIKNYVPYQHRWKAIAIYLFSTSYYLLNFSALRQGLAVSLCVLSVILVAKEKFKLAILLNLMVGTIHASALVLLPFMPLFKISLKGGRKYAAAIFILTVTLFLSSSFVGQIFERIIWLVPVFAKNYGHYVSSIEVTGTRIGYGLLLHSVGFLTLIFFMFNRFEEFTHTEKIFILLTSVSYCIWPFQMNVTGLFSRVITYFSVFEIVAVPLVYNKIRDKYLRFGVSFVYIFLLFYHYYYFFFVQEWSANSYKTFHTIFDLVF